MWKTFALGLGLAAAPTAPLAAQQAAQQDVAPAHLTPEDALEKERQVYGAPAPHPKPAPECDPDKASSDNGEIVVCARKPEDNAQFRVKSTAELDPRSHQNLYDGLPRGPDVSGLPDCSSGCMRIGKTPTRPLMIDLKAIPEPPPGSDADKIAKGEKAAP